ncbi:MAG: hypothetical protein GDA50_07085 [Alphaproteobacteria bacterium GM202ARS2]|nr:hypothetical protein [Alphaproteobacteria bacterium GM202ARS2]
MFLINLYVRRGRLKHLALICGVVLQVAACGGGGGGDGGGGGGPPATPTPGVVVRPAPEPVSIAFAADVQSADLEEAVTSDRLNTRAKDANDDDVGTDIDVVVRDETVPLPSDQRLGGLVGFALPPGGCRVINNGLYDNYLVSHRHGGGELGCEKSCSGSGVVTATKVKG